MSVAAVDIGGTRTRVARVDDGRITSRREVPTELGRGALTAVREVGDLIDEVLADAPDSLRAIGLSITGPVDTVTGVVDNPYTLRGWGAVDVVTPIRDRFGVPTELLNDADAAALGEWAAGTGRGRPRMVMITLGTGIGMGVIHGGAIDRRGDGAHAEAGHHVIDPGGPSCSCGARGCWESLASGQALVRLAEHRYPGGPDRSVDLDERARVLAAAVIRGAEAGEPWAAQTVDELAGWVGLGLVNVAAFLVPDAIVIGGGLGARIFELIEPTVAAVLSAHGGIVRTDIDLLRARTGDDAGLLGAAFSVADPSVHRMRS